MSTTPKSTASSYNTPIPNMAPMGGECQCLVVIASTWKEMCRIRVFIVTVSTQSFNTDPSGGVCVCVCVYCELYCVTLCFVTTE